MTERQTKWFCRIAAVLLAAGIVMDIDIAMRLGLL